MALITKQLPLTTTASKVSIKSNAGTIIYLVFNLTTECYLAATSGEIPSGDELIKITTDLTLPLSYAQESMVQGIDLYLATVAGTNTIQLLVNSPTDALTVTIT